MALLENSDLGGAEHVVFPKTGGGELRLPYFKSIRPHLVRWEISRDDLRYR
jgi:hypothetical protein